MKSCRRRHSQSSSKKLRLSLPNLQLLLPKIQVASATTMARLAFPRLSHLFVQRSGSALATSNIAVKAAPSGRWTLRDKAPRSAPYLQR